MLHVKAIPTEWRGTLFRSRLEARWAVFLSALKIEWYYEHEGYVLPAGRYLPDFWLPEIDGGTIFEVKGEIPTQRAGELAFQLARASEKRVVIRSGEVTAKQTPNRDGFIFEDRGGFLTLASGGGWLQCTKCGRLTFQPLYYASWCTDCCDSFHAGRVVTDTERLSFAYEAAQRMRFW